MKRLSWLLALAAPLGCSEVIIVDNAPPTIELAGVCQAPDTGRWYLALDTADAEHKDLTLRLVTASGEAVAPGPTGAGLAGLPPGRPPALRRHLVEWLQTSDAGDAPCDAVPETLPGTSTGCATVGPAGPDLPLTLTAFVDDQNEVTAFTLTVSEALPAEDCRATR